MISFIVGFLFQTFICREFWPESESFWFLLFWFSSFHFGSPIRRNRANRFRPKTKPKTEETETAKRRLNNLNFWLTFSFLFLFLFLFLFSFLFLFGFHLRQTVENVLVNIGLNDRNSDIQNRSCKRTFFQSSQSTIFFCRNLTFCLQTFLQKSKKITYNFRLL